MPRITSWLEVEKRLANYSNTLKSAEDRLVKTNDSLNIMLNSLIINLKDLLESQSDISLWFYDEDEPTTSNQPYISWTTPSDHYGDFFYSRTKGLVYQFTSSGWNKLDDATLLNALALTNAKLESGDHERKIFLDNPVTPYESGDWWIREDGTLYICQISRASGKREENDYIDALKYAQAVAKATDNLVEVLKGTMITTTDSAVVYEDKATHKTTTISGDSVRTGEIISNNYVANTSGTKFNLNTGEILSKNFSIDSSGNAKFKGTVEATSGTFGSIITNQGLLSTLQFNGIGANGDFFGATIDYSGVNPAYADIPIVIPYSIPTDFVIKNAYIVLVSTPIKWNSSVWGRAQGIKVYRVSDNPLITAEYGGEYYTTSNKTQIKNVFGSGSSEWTPSAPSDSSHPTQTKNTVNLSTSYFSAGANGKFMLVANRPSGTVSQSAVMPYYGNVKAYLIVRGFTQP
jgi:hypothetical protein